MKKGVYTDIDVIEKGWFFNRKVRVGLPSEALQKAIQDAMDHNIYSDRTHIVHSDDSRAAKKLCKDNTEGYSVKKSYRKDGWEGSALNLFGSQYQNEKAVCVGKETDKLAFNSLDTVSRKKSLRSGAKDAATDISTATNTTTLDTTEDNNANASMEIKTDPVNNYSKKIKPEFRKNKDMDNLWKQLKKKTEWEKPANKDKRQRLEKFLKGLDSTATVVVKSSGDDKTVRTASATARSR